MAKELVLVVLSPLAQVATQVVLNRAVLNLVVLAQAAPTLVPTLVCLVPTLVAPQNLLSLVLALIAPTLVVLYQVAIQAALILVVLYQVAPLTLVVLTQAVPNPVVVPLSPALALHKAHLIPQIVAVLVVRVVAHFLLTTLISSTRLLSGMAARHSGILLTV